MNIAAPSHREEPAHFFSVRALVIGLLLVIVFSVAGAVSVLVRYEIIGTGYLPRGAISILFLLALLNISVGRLIGRWRLRRHELLLIFCMLLAMAAVPGQEFSQHVYLNLLGLVYLSGGRTAYGDVVIQHVPHGLVPSLNPSAHAVTYAFESLPAGESTPFGAWGTTLLAWTPYWFLLYAFITCCAAVIFRQWHAHERLLFPLAQVPVELADTERGESDNLLRSPMMWGCFALSASLYVVKGLHTYFPLIPDIRLQGTTGILFSGGPARAFNNMRLHLYPEMVGIAYLLTSEVSFSIWFFNLFREFEEMLRNAFGFTLTPHRTFFQYQTVGGYIVLAAAVLWAARGHLRSVWYRARGRITDTVDVEDPLPYRLAVWGGLAAFALLVSWALHFGVGAPWALLYFVGFPLVGLIVSRVVCEAGMFIYSSPFRLNDVLFEMFDTRRIGARSTVVLTMMSWAQVRSTATMNMPAILQGYQIARHGRLHPRRTSAAMLLSIFVAILVCHVVSLQVIYTHGVGKLGWWPSRAPVNTASKLAGQLQSPRVMTPGNWAAVGWGGLFTGFLVFMRQRFLWWPFHPLGFVAWLGWPTERYWFSILLGWLAKVLVLKYGGYTVFRRLRPAAFGLILGICFVLTAWLVIHFFYPGPILLIE